MNAYITDALAREHQASMLADAAANRAAHRAGAARRARRASGRSAHHTVPGSVRALGRPFTVIHHWIASGQL